MISIMSDPKPNPEPEPAKKRRGRPPKGETPQVDTRPYRHENFVFMQKVDRVAPELNVTSDAQLGRIAECSQQLVADWRKGKGRLGVLHVLRLAQALRVDPWWLADPNNDNPPQPAEASGAGILPPGFADDAEVQAILKPFLKSLDRLLRSRAKTEQAPEDQREVNRVEEDRPSGEEPDRKD